MGDVKKRVPPATRRAQSAAETRGRIMVAAHELFVAQGYAKTSLRAVAERAGVAEKTLYLAFGTKPALLAQTTDMVLAGDARAVPIADRLPFAAMLEASDPRLMFRLWAVHQDEMFRRAGPLIEMVRAAKESDPDLAAIWQERYRGLMMDVARLSNALLTEGHLAKGVTARAATDAIYTLSSPEVHRLLVGDLGYSRARYRAWLEDSLWKMLAKR